MDIIPVITSQDSAPDDEIGILRLYSSLNGCDASNLLHLLADTLGTVLHTAAATDRNLTARLHTDAAAANITL